MTREEPRSSWATAGWGIRGPRNDAMTREEQIEQIVEVLAPAPLAILDEQGLRMWAERIVDALQPVEDTSDSTQAKVDRMRALTESVRERNQRIERLKSG